MFGPRVGFVKFRSEALVVTDTGIADGTVGVPSIVFMRGGSVGVLIVLECEGEEFTILTHQARVAAHDHSLPEIPCGMMDGSGNFKGEP